MTERPRNDLTETLVDRKIEEKVTAALKAAARQTPTERAALAMQQMVTSSGKSRPKSGYALIALAIVIEAVELGRYWLINHPLHMPPQIIAGVIGFIGFYVRNPKQTKDGALILADIGTRFVAVFRTGKRRDDVKVVEIEKEKPPAEGDPG